jgi:hypothetical protein
LEQDSISLKRTDRILLQESRQDNEAGGHAAFERSRRDIDSAKATIRMMARLFIVLTLLGAPATSWAAGQPPLFPSERAASQACPNDIVVWLNTRSGIYHYKGQPWYATTTVGAYVCKAEADQAGKIPGDLPIPGRQ